MELADFISSSTAGLNPDFNSWIFGYPACVVFMDFFNPSRQML
jgi:hypothetical protein